MTVILYHSRLSFHRKTVQNVSTVFEFEETNEWIVVTKDDNREKFSITEYPEMRIQQ